MESAAGGDVGGEGLLTAIFRGMMVVAWILLPIFVIYLIISKEARKRFLRDILIMLPILAMLYWFSNQVTDQEASEESLGSFNLGEMEMAGETSAPPAMPEFQAPPEWISTVASVVLAVVIIAIIGGVIFAIWRRSREKDDVPLRRIEFKAREALASIETGGDLSEVIQRCYLQMVEALRETMNIYRARDVTPSEFEATLVKRGLPREAVHQLTQLFEQVRYGGQRPGPAEERAAINSLSAIVSACERSQEREINRRAQNEGIS